MYKTEERKQQQRRMPHSAVRAKKRAAAASFFKSFITSLLAIVIFAAIVYRDDAMHFAQDLIALLKGEKNSKAEFGLPFVQKRQNILVMGVDVNHEGSNPFKNSRTDTMVLVSIAPNAKDVNVISIPRDSKVYLANSHKADKINHAFAKGGVNMAVKTVEETFGVKVNHYLVVNNQGAINFINDIGGVPVYVEKDMHYGDKYGGLYINLRQGDRVLTGEQAEGFLRFRNDSLGDIGRIRRQQFFFNALLERVKDPQVVIKLPEAIKRMGKYIQTDMTFFEISQYALLAKSINKSDIQTATIPGSPSTKGEISYWIVDPEMTQEMIDKLVYRDRPEVLEGPLRAGILYTNQNSERANKLREVFEQNGVEVKMQQREKLGHSHIAVHNLSIPTDAISQLKKTTPELNDKQTVYDQIGINRAGKDFTVVLAGS